MQRRREREWMDDAGLDVAKHRAALAALRRTNKWLGVDGQLMRAVHRAVLGDDCSVLEIGAGGGGWLAAAARSERGRRWRLMGLDRSIVALRDAREQVSGTGVLGAFPSGTGAGRYVGSVVGTSGAHVQFVCGDALSLPFTNAAVDVVVCSLLLHHFDPPEAIRLLSEAKRVARRAVVVGDLSRSGLAWALTWVTTRLTSRSAVFHVDGPRSVRAAYRPDEALQLTAEAGMVGAVVRRAFPFRWIMTWRREHA